MLLQQQQLYLQLELEQQQLSNQQQQLANCQRMNSIQKDQDKSNLSLLNSTTQSNKDNNSEPNSPLNNSAEQSKDKKLEKDEQLISMMNSSNSPSLNIVKTENAIDNQIDLNKIDEMKVNDLKQELKRFNLPISGSKNALLERLKNYVTKNRQSIKTNSPSSIVESMEIDYSPQKPSSTISSSNSSLTSNNNSSSITSSTNQNFYCTNTISSTPVTTFATLAPLIKTHQLNLANLKSQHLQQETILNQKPRRISEPQLQHIQLHFANPFLQFATTANQSPLGHTATPLTTNHHHNSAQQIHFLSTPALNSNDLHLITQPLINNRTILQSNASLNASATLNTASASNQSTTWTLQPTNSFPQLFFYPTQLAAANNLISSNNSNSTPANLIIPSSLSSSSTSLNNNSNLTKNSNLHLSDSELITATVVTNTLQQQQQQQQQKTTKTNKKYNKNGNSKGNSKQQTKANKKNDLNKKMSISLSNNGEHNCPINENNVNNVNNNSLMINNGVNSMINLVNSQMNNLTSNNVQIKGEINNENSSSYPMRISNQEQQSFLRESTSILIDKPPPNYQEFLVSKQKKKSLINNSSTATIQSNLTFSTATNLNRSNELNDEANGNVIIMNANYSKDTIKQTNNNYESNKITNLINSSSTSALNIGTDSILTTATNSTITANVTGKTNNFQQSSSLDSSALNFRNLVEFKNLKENKLEDANLSPASNIHLNNFHSNVHSNIAHQTNFPHQTNVQTNHHHHNKFYSTNCISIEKRTMNEYSTNSFYNMNNNSLANCISQQPEVNGSNSQLNQIVSNNSNVSNGKQEIDFNLDFDLLMEDLTDFVDFDYDKSKELKQDEIKIENDQTNFMDIDSTRLTINTNFDQFSVSEQSLHTPTLPDSQEQILNSLIETNQSNSMIYDNHHFWHHNNEDYSYVL